MSGASTDVEHLELLELATRLTLDAGRLVSAGRAAGLRDVDTKSSATDVVTEFDRAAEALIVEGIRAARPHDAIVGEEGADRRGSSGYVWQVDPIDGTTNFLYALPTYSVSVGVQDAAGGVAGVVNAPALGELFQARRGAGATLNGAPISVSACPSLDTALVATGFAYQPARREAQATRLVRVLPRVRDVRRLGSAALDLCYVAAGRYDGYYEQWLNSWDVAAGLVIASEAGAVIDRFAGAPGEPDGLLVATPPIHPALRSLLDESSRRISTGGVAQRRP